MKRKMHRGWSGKNVRVVALTGGFGSGKSTVLRFLKQKGAKTIDCDRIVHDLLNGHRPLLKKIELRYGSEVFDSKWRLNRKKLAEKVFSSTTMRTHLERLVHPLVRKRIRFVLRRTKHGVVIVDIPLYFESGWEKRMKPVIVVDSNRAQQIKRLLKKGFHKTDIMRRLKVQWPLKEKVAKADFVINNKGRLDQTKKQTDVLWKKIS